MFEDNETMELPQSSLVSRNITVMGRRTSVRLEPEMWSSLREIAKREKCKIHDLCSLVYLRKSEQTSLTAAIRVFIMLYFRAAATEDGHLRAGHGRFENMIRRARVALDASVGSLSRISLAKLSEKNVRTVEAEDTDSTVAIAAPASEAKLNHFAVYSG